MQREPGSGRQQEVYQFIKMNPGTHLREIQRRLSVSSMGNLEYHITMLKKLKLVVENSEGGYKRYYPTHGAIKNKQLLALLRQKNPRRIALLILESMRKNGCLDLENGNANGIVIANGNRNGAENEDEIESANGNRDGAENGNGVEQGAERGVGKGVPMENDAEVCGLTPFDLMGELGLKPSALSYYLSKMRKQDVLRKEKVGKNVFYVLVRPEEVMQILISHRESFMDRLVNSFMEGCGL